MIRQAFPPSATFFSNDFFSLQIKPQKVTMNICMVLKNDIINTLQLPYTHAVLSKLLPSILQATCFNDEKLPFYVEVQRTEVGHLFEHILLEYLCQLKLQQGSTSATYSGTTNWNWKKEQRGTFHILIRTGANRDNFIRALDKAIKLMVFLMQGEEVTEQPRQNCPDIFSEKTNQTIAQVQ